MDDYKIFKLVLAGMHSTSGSMVNLLECVASVFGKEAEGILDLQKGGGL